MTEQTTQLACSGEKVIIVGIYVAICSTQSILTFKDQCTSGFLNSHCLEG